MSDKHKYDLADMADWARYCYKAQKSNWKDGYARSHWMLSADAEKCVRTLKERGDDAFVEYKRDGHESIPSTTGMM